ncbi:MAG: DUF4424 family protein [bacterium]|nr:DUF4424 family protein [bacterium]
MRTESCRRRVAVTVSLLVLAGRSAHADDGVFEGSGGTVSLSGSDHVRMVAEEVVFDLRTPDVIRVSCLFVVVNEGPADTLLLGFPDYWPDADDDSPRPGVVSAIEDLVVTVDGRPVDTTALPAKDAPTAIGTGDQWCVPYNVAHVWNCSFAPGQTRVLRTEYSHGYSGSTSSSYNVSYVLRTGASWAGSIGAVVLRLIPGQMSLKDAWYPPEWHDTGTEFVWAATDLEPDCDIEVGMEIPAEYAAHLARAWRGEYDQGGAVAPEDAHRWVFGSSIFRHCRPQFLVEVSRALGSSLPDLSRELAALADSLSEEFR